MPEDVWKVLLLLKEPALVISSLVMTVLFYLVFWLIKTRDRAILDVVTKIDIHTASNAKLVTMLETLIGMGRIK